eukprot:TRINITY_DN13586_c0_g1_i1.p1 TRINITY_DN13586_c0_g1~~TRINITY_DN13586_c0_g1_i1.p1  ORF type:complete len:423 (+),score=-20.67 TRINITY_DN13586_c0_g1_i1:3-1271(+)
MIPNVTPRQYNRFSSMYADMYPKGSQHSEDTLMNFMMSIMRSYGPGSFYPIMSHVKQYIRLEENQDVGECARLTLLMKSVTKNHSPRKAPGFSQAHIFGYLDQQAPGDNYILRDKAAIIVCFFGCLRIEEVSNLRWDFIDRTTADGLLFKVIRSKKSTTQQFLKMIPNVTPRQYNRFSSMYADMYPKGSQHSEDTLMNFMMSIMRSYGPGSFYPIMSHVKQYIRLEENQDVGECARLTLLMKSVTKNHSPRKAPGFSQAHIFGYLDQQAPGDNYILRDKAAIIVCFFGCLRIEEVSNLRWDFIDRTTADGLLFKVIRSKKSTTQQFLKMIPNVTPEGYIFNPVNIINEYINAVPTELKDDKLFLRVDSRTNSFVHQNFGKGSLSSIPKRIANFFHLPNADTYTGHSKGLLSDSISKCRRDSP